MKEVYLIDTGILLAKDNPEYELYDIVYDKKHAFYDENQYYVDTLEEAKNHAKEYVKRGVDNTYAVISSSTLPDDIDVSEAIVEDECYSTESVIYSIKKENDELIENFLSQTENNYE